MTKLIVNIGETANDRNADSLRSAFTKINENFTELYTALGLTVDTTLSLGAFEFNGSTMTTTDSSSITIDQAVTVSSDLTVGGDLLPSIANGGNLGSSLRPWKSIYVSNNTIYLNNIPVALDESNNLTVNGVAVNSVGSADWSTITSKPAIPADIADLTDTGGLLGQTDRLVSGANQLVFGGEINPAALTWPDGSWQATAFVGIAQDISNIGNPTIVSGSDTTPQTWTFKTDGELQIPNQGSIRQNNSWTRTVDPVVSVGAGSVVWTSAVDYISSAKLVIQVEGNEVGDLTGWHSQACEAIISCRGYANVYGGPGGDPQMIVYGVVHTSVDPLVTFTVQRNPTTKFVEVVGTLTAAASGNAALRIHSVEMSTRD